MFLVALTLAVSGSLDYLAGTTSVLLLTIFFSVNVGLLRIKLRDAKPRIGFQLPIWIPGLAVAACVVLIGFAQQRSLLPGAAVIVFASVRSHFWPSGDRSKSS